MAVDTSVFDRVSEEQEWNESSQVSILLEYIENQEDYESFEAYILQRQDEENTFP